MKVHLLLGNKQGPPREAHNEKEGMLENKPHACRRTRSQREQKENAKSIPNTMHKYDARHHPYLKTSHFGDRFTPMGCQ